MKIREYPIPVGSLAFIAAGGAASLVAQDNDWPARIWMAGLLITAAPMLWGTLRRVIRGQFAADLVAALAVIASVLLGQPVVGLVIVLMQTGGEALEHVAEGKAGDALRALEKAAPRIVHRVDDAEVIDVEANDIRAGDTILVRPGEMIPCDGSVIDGISSLDTASITGEPLPRKILPGSAVMSGSVNQHGPVKIHVTAIAADSQYAKIVALVRNAQASKAPLQRVADRYAVFFTPLTIAICAAAFALSRDWHRVLAVLAIATPCPLILATPVAILGGLNRSARKQVLIRNGGALEGLSSITAIVFDKTGTVTIGRPEVSRVVATGDLSVDEMLRLASGVEQGSGHLLARTLVHEAERVGLSLPGASEVVESPGRGVEGQVESRRVTVGARSFVDERSIGTATVSEDADSGASLRAYVAIDGVIAGFVEYADMIRPAMRQIIDRLRATGAKRIMLLSGDRVANVRAAAASIGVREFRGDMLPEDKVQVVKRLLEDGERVAMIGDGTNDAPALGTATVGIALASHGRGIATEAADVILLADDPARIVDAVGISRRTMRIARQSIGVGLGISAAGMLFAMMGFIAPVAGAALQEFVDLAVILNALRASRDEPYGKSRANLLSLPTEDAALQS